MSGGSLRAGRDTTASVSGRLAAGEAAAASGVAPFTNLLWIYPTLPTLYPLRGHVRHIHRRLVTTRKATRTGAPARALVRPGVVGDPGMCGRSLHGNREISRPTGGRCRRSAPGRRGAVAGDARGREVIPGPGSSDLWLTARSRPRRPRAKRSSGQDFPCPVSDPAIVARKPTNAAGRPAAEPVERRAGAEGNAGQQRTRRAQDRASVSQVLGRVRRAARHRRRGRFTALFHHLSPGLLREAFLALKRDAAPGVDGLTWRAYEADLDRRIEALHARVRRGAYRALPSRRRYIPKPDGRERPLAVAALEDKIVQKATAAVLNAIYEEDFLGFSYGFRPGRGQHDALDALVVGITGTKVNHILDCDIRSFFDAVSQEWLVRFLEHRIADRRIIRLIRKWLKAGVLEDGVVTVSDTESG